MASRGTLRWIGTATSSEQLHAANKLKALTACRPPAPCCGKPGVFHIGISPTFDRYRLIEGMAPLGGTMGKSTTAALALIFGTALYIGQPSLAHAQQATIKRTDLANADQSATEAGALWIGDIPPGAATGIS
jgi:hypothetical protein